MTANIEAAAKFIKAYRQMEGLDYNFGYSVIHRCAKLHLRAHLCRSWKGRKKDFGDFFLNLDHVTQGRIITSWGIPIEGYEEYCRAVEASPVIRAFLDLPPVISWLHELLKFFYNHAVMDECAPGIKLPRKPRKGREFGNSTNWGKYILELRWPDAVRLLENLEAYILKTTMNPTSIP